MLNDELTIKITWKHPLANDNRWIGIGFGNSMASADTVMCLTSDQAVSCRDGFSLGYVVPTNDTVDSYSIKSYKVIPKYKIEVIITRKLDTGDTQDQKLEEGGAIDVIWALGAQYDGVPQKHVYQGLSSIEVGWSHQAAWAGVLAISLMSLLALSLIHISSPRD